MESFWNHLPRPFFVLAPMADVTDPAYRSVIAEYGKPDVTWTEFVSADGLYATRERKGLLDAENPLMRDLQFGEGERPIVAQLFTSNPEHMAYAAGLCRELGFDGVDINMGCPDRSIEKQGAGAAHIRDADTARAVYRAAASSGLPVSIKTRIGYNSDVLEEWLSELLREHPAALTVHLRTRKEMSKVPAHWEHMGRVVALRDAIAPHVPVIGNGDVTDLKDAREKALASGADGIMLGRAIFGNPWLFTGRDTATLSPRERVDALLVLAERFEKLTPPKHYATLKKHFKAFVHGWPGAGDLRARLMETHALAELREVIAESEELV